MNILSVFIMHATVTVFFWFLDKVTGHWNQKTDTSDGKLCVCVCVCSAKITLFYCIIVHLLYNSVVQW